MNTGYPHSCIVEEETVAPNAYGNRTLTWTALGERVNCRLDIRNRRTAETPFTEAAMVTTYTLVGSRRAPFRPGMRVRDVRDGAGALIDAGPFRADQVNQRRGPTGAVLMQTAELERQGDPLVRATETTD